VAGLQPLLWVVETGADEGTQHDGTPAFACGGLGQPTGRPVPPLHPVQVRARLRTVEHRAEPGSEVGRRCGGQGVCHSRRGDRRGEGGHECMGRAVLLL
jgi:hypothetical protein